MSLYNMLFGKNAASDVFLAMLGLSQGDCGRFRDCYPSEDGTKIHIYTRNGGGNRDDYQQVFDTLAEHPCYLRDADDDFDCTYATITFKTPDQFVEQVKALADQTDNTPPMEKFQKLIADMKSGTDNAVVSRATEVGSRIVAALEAGESTAVKTPDGSVQIITGKS